MQFKFSIADLIWLTLWVAVLAAITGGMFQVRAAVLKSSNETSQADWNQWRESVKKGETDDVGPVKRKVPKSLEPPTLVLMRDHFPTCLAGLLVISSVLFATLVFFARGVLAQRSPR